jgi:hypothetical protein
VVGLHEKVLTGPEQLSSHEGSFANVCRPGVYVLAQLPPSHAYSSGVGNEHTPSQPYSLNVPFTSARTHAVSFVKAPFSFWNSHLKSWLGAMQWSLQSSGLM